MSLGELRLIPQITFCPFGQVPITPVMRIAMFSDNLRAASPEIVFDQYVTASVGAVLDEFWSENARTISVSLSTLVVAPNAFAAV